MRHSLKAGALLCMLAACTHEAVGPMEGDAPAGARSAGGVPPPGDEEQQSGKSRPRFEPGDLERHVWYDADAEREVWLDPSAVADHAPSEKSRAALVERAPGAEELTAPNESVRIWRLPAGGPRSSELCSVLWTAGAEGRFSPIFHLRPDRESPRTSLPGGVILSFSAEWTDAAAEGWLASRGLAVVKRLALGAPAFVVSSPPGLPALALASDLRSAPDLRWAQPDWWLPTTER